MTLLVSDICSWFQLQQGATRLETVVNLLQMLYPLELQFVGACLEDLVRRDYHCLRDVEHRFNIPDIVARLTDLNDGRCRASLIVALSLLKSTNHSTASTVYRILFSFHVLFRQLPKTKDVIDEILLLLTMAKHHPAFKFEQKNSIAGLFEEIVDLLRENSCENAGLGATINNTCDESNTKSTCGGANRDKTCCASTQTSQEDLSEYAKIPSVPAAATLNPGSAVNSSAEHSVSGSLTVNTPAEADQCDVYIAKVKIIRHECRGNMFEFLIEVTWSNNMVTEINRTQEDLYEFHRQLLDLNPSEAGCFGAARRIPYFLGYDCSAAEPKNRTGAQSTPDIVNIVYSYFQDFLAVSPDILASKCTIRFFKDDGCPIGAGGCSSTASSSAGSSSTSLFDDISYCQKSGKQMSSSSSSTHSSKNGVVANSWSEHGPPRKSSSQRSAVFTNSNSTTKCYARAASSPSAGAANHNSNELSEKVARSDKVSTSLPASKSQSPDPANVYPAANGGEPVAKGAGGCSTPFGMFPLPPSAMAQQQQQNSSHQLRKSMTTPNYGTAQPGAYFKQQPIRCLLPAASYEAPPQPNFAHCCTYAPTLPPPVAYNLQGAPNFPFFAPLMPPPGHPGSFRFICGPPPAVSASVVVSPSCQCNNSGSCQMCISSSNRS